MRNGQSIKRPPAPKTVKAYRDDVFLNSREARTVRVICEFEAPQKKLREEKIKHTLVFFGSARTPAREDAQAKLAAAKSALAAAETPETRQQLARAEHDLTMSRYYEEAANISESLTRWSEGLSEETRFVVCSGGGPGIMEAANLGAYRANARSIGLNISLPHEQEPNPFQSPELAFDFHYFFIRKYWFLHYAKALIVFPGGFGTMDELFELLTLVQTKKASRYMPVVLYGKDYWQEVVNFDAMVKWGVISADDLNLFRICDDEQSVVDYITSEMQERYLR